MQKPLDTLMEKEVSRKEFLSILALSLASIMGFSNIIKLLTGKSLDHLKTPGNDNYNSSDYGG
jgi:hypothetical protein